MLCFDTRSIESQAIQVDDDLAADDPVWQEGDPRLAESVHVTGRLSLAGEGRYYFSGQLESVVAGECRRCLVPVTQPVSEEVQLFFAEEGDETAEDDPDVFPIDPQARDLDLREAIHEQFVLVAPQYALCRDDCLGLCPTCGADRNAGECGCPAVADARWDALRSVEDRGTSR